MKPWDYDATLVTSTVQKTIKASEQAAAAKGKTSSSASKTASAKPKVRKKKPAAQPGTAVQDPNKAAGNAAENDLSSVCSAAS